MTDNVNSSRPQHADIPEQRRNSESEPPTEPAPSGLEVFDLGSVPASVTPPRTWRRAAWFATVSSGSVVGLLFAGAFLLGHQPEQDQTSGDGTYLDHNHNAALIERGRQSTAQQPTPGEAPNSDRATGSTTATSAVAQPHDPSARANTAGAPSATPSANPSTTQDPDGTGAANRPIRATAGDSPSSSTEQPPETVVSPQHSVMPQRAVTDREPQHMAQVSTDYLDAVAQDPERAMEYTSGELRDGGTSGLRQKYERVARFDVRRVTVKPDEGVTQNQVRTTYEDGHTERESVRLTFDEDGRITHAAR